MSINRSVERLLKYRLSLLKFKAQGFDNFYSKYLAEEVDVSPEQVRKDFSEKGIKGRKKAGYNVDETLLILNNILQRDSIRNIIVVGIGNIGRAMIYNFKNFQKNNFSVVAAFDINPAKQKMYSGIKVYRLDNLKEIVKKNKVKTAIIAVPTVSAQLVCDKLIDCGIIGIMNFAPVVLKVPKDVISRNINLCNELEGIMHSANLLIEKK